MINEVSPKQFSFDAGRFATFARQTLTKEEAEERISKLFEMQKQLAQEQGEVSKIKEEFSEKEIKQLEQLLYEEVIVTPRSRIERGPYGEFYFVKFSESSISLTRNNFLTAKKLIMAMQRLSGGSERDILEFLVNPKMKEMTFYQENVLKHASTIDQEEFLSDAKNRYSASMSLLSAAHKLPTTGGLFADILGLHTKLSGLYEAQITLNKMSQTALLKYADGLLRTVTKICNLLERCGIEQSTLGSDSKRGYDRLKDELNASSKELSSTLSQVTDESSNLSKKIHELKGQAVALRGKIPGKEKLKSVANSVECLQKEREDCSKKEKAAKEKYENFLNAKTEYAKQGKNFLQMNWWETFGAGLAPWRQYEIAKEAFEKAKREISGSEAHIDKGITLPDCSEKTIDEIAVSLTSVERAIAAVNSSVEAKIFQTNSQIHLIKKELENEDSSSEIQDVMRKVADCGEKIILAHAFWFGIERQNYVIRSVSKDLSQLDVSLIEGGETGKKAVTDRLKELRGGEIESAPRYTIMFQKPESKLLLTNWE